MVAPSHTSSSRSLTHQPCRPRPAPTLPPHLLTIGKDARLAASELSATSTTQLGPAASVTFAPLDSRKQQLCRQLLATLSRWRSELAPAMAVGLGGGSPHHQVRPAMVHALHFVCHSFLPFDFLSPAYPPMIRRSSTPWLATATATATGTGMGMGTTRPATRLRARSHSRRRRPPAPSPCTPSTSTSTTTRCRCP